MVKISLLAETHICKTTTWLCLLSLMIVLANCNGTARQESTQNKNLSKSSIDKPATQDQSTSGWQSGQPTQATSEILVKFQTNTDSSTIAKIQEELQLKTVQILSSQNIYVMQSVGNASIDSIIAKIQEYEGVIYAEPNYQRRTN